jgi:putative membrane protein
MHRPLTSEEQERISAAVAAAEKATNTNFSVAIVKVSDRYRLYPPVWAAVLAIIGLGIAALLRPSLSISTGFMIAAVLFIALTFILDWLPLRLAVVPKRVKHRRADEMAHRQFAACVLANAKQNEGVLIFVSLGEHFVEVLASRNIHAAVPEGTWDRVVADLIMAVKSGRLAEGLVQAIGASSSAINSRKH